MRKPSTFSSDSPSFPWWLILLEGITLVILGILLLAFPKIGTFAVAQILGIFWLTAGIFEIISIFHDRSMWGWKLFTGILGIIGGILVSQRHLWSTAITGATLILILGLEGLIIGGTRIYKAFRGAGLDNAILGILSVFFGIFLLYNIWVVTLTLPWGLGALAIAGGIFAIVMAFQLK